ncbi:NAD(P)-dependent oxidoreductase [Planctomonas sp. JC2975]|uniref:NAD-dependent epimerase/dehydratase family protein n=1 Tax=Planctomonas sp. JC2975 TaxID=2729626 RepID=UPI0014746801|nr:NAD(P)-dependent oxidoreductase [Planctomonas sp. JC2975]NNC13700.1 NAD(P)-dependent oxidoreductase [Planctomonas sp. JC2975]
MTQIDGRRVLVTGAAGRIGSVTTRHLAEQGALVTALCQPGQAVDGADRVVHGDTRSERDVAAALADVELVVHLAALPHRDAGSPYDVYATNVISTFNVLTQAAQRGVRRAVVAGSINRYGLPQGVDRDARPPYFPLDTDIPADVSDWYSLSKLNDENASHMVNRRWGVDIVTLRFPHVNTMAALTAVAAQLTADPRPGLTEAWAYLDVRDAARAIELGLETDARGANAFYLAAPTTSIPYRTEDVLDALAPDVPRHKRFVEREVPMDLTDAERLIGFRAQHLLDLETRDLPADIPLTA